MFSVYPWDWHLMIVMESSENIHLERNHWPSWEGLLPKEKAEDPVGSGGWKHEGRSLHGNPQRIDTLKAQVWFESGCGQRWGWIGRLSHVLGTWNAHSSWTSPCSNLLPFISFSLCLLGNISNIQKLEWVTWQTSVDMFIIFFHVLFYK